MLLDLKEIKISSKDVADFFENKFSIGMLKTTTNVNGLADAYNVGRKTVVQYMTALKNGSITLKEGQTYLAGYQSYLKQTTKATTIADLKTKALTTSMQLLSTIGWMAAITAATWLIGKLIGSINDAIHASEIAREKSSELTDSWNSENTSIDSSIKKYKDLKEKNTL